MAVDITIDVQDYLPSYLDGPGTVLLQSPVSPGRQLRDEILVRQDQGRYKNEVSFKPTVQISRLDHGQRSAYAHGVLIQSHPDRGYLRGDRIWLTETACEEQDASTPDQNNMAAVNLRTWAPVTVALDDVCWIPKFRKIDCCEDEEELLTISGPPVRKHDRKIYLLAVVQRLRVKNGSTRVEKIEVREIVEQDAFKYQNLTTVPDGKQKTADLFHRSLAAMAPKFFETGVQEPTATPPSTEMLKTGSGPDQPMSLATPPPEEESTEVSSLSFETRLSLTEGEKDPDVKRKMLELQRVVEAKKARKCRPLIPAGPPPEDTCNLGSHCPTPHKVFFQTNRPSLENLYPRHHHRPDHECPIGAAHPIHCVFKFLPGKDVADKRLCIIPTTVRHHCCETNARPVNKTFRRRPEMADGGCGSAQPMPFVTDRGLGELGRRLYGYGDRAGMAGSEGVAHSKGWPGGLRGGDGGAGVDDECRLHAVHGLSREHQQIHQGRPCVLLAGALSTTSPPVQPATPAPGSAPAGPITLREDDDDDDDGDNAEEADTFGDRHFHDDEDARDGEMRLYDD